MPLNLIRLDLESFLRMVKNIPFYKAELKTVSQFAEGNLSKDEKSLNRMAERKHMFEAAACWYNEDGPEAEFMALFTS